MCTIFLLLFIFVIFFGAHELYTFRTHTKKMRAKKKCIDGMEEKDLSEGKYLSYYLFNRKQCKNKYCAIVLPVDADADDDDRV